MGIQRRFVRETPLLRPDLLAPIDAESFYKACDSAAKEYPGKSPFALLLYYQEKADAFNASIRYLALLMLARNGHLDRWIRHESETSRLIHDSAYRAAAVCPLNNEGFFDPER